MKLNKKLELGMKVVSVLKNRSTPTKSSDLAKEIGTTTHFLEQIMRNLKNSDLVVVKRGPGGGYVTNPDAVITAYQVATAVGRDFGEIRFDEDPTTRLQKSITEAFKELVI